jgi:hypothetical protein
MVPAAMILSPEHVVQNEFGAGKRRLRRQAAKSDFRALSIVAVGAQGHDYRSMLQFNPEQLIKE